VNSNVSTATNAEVFLGRRQLYILPSAAGGLYAVLVAVVLIAAINYGNGMIFGLAFLLAAIGVVSMLHTHRNLHRLRLRAAAASPVFAGETARFPVCLTNDSARPRHALAIEHEGCVLETFDLAPRAEACAMLPVTARRRGWLEAPAFHVSTRFPLGLLYSWSRRVRLESRCLVYPAPAAAGAVITEAGGGESGEGAARSGAGEDFLGQREYRAGDSLRHVNWRAVARGQGWLTKEFGGGAGSTVWLDWDDWPGLEAEARLSLLCRAVLDAERAGLAYGLRLPGETLAPAAGEDHQARCLERLALFDQADSHQLPLSREGGRGMGRG
jgi:uncharacterized protein (DUF58 family)